jgi:hypothetical protein
MDEPAVVAAPAVQHIWKRHPLAITKLFDGNEVVKVVVFQESELTLPSDSDQDQLLSRRLPSASARLLADRDRPIKHP